MIRVNTKQNWVIIGSYGTQRELCQFTYFRKFQTATNSLALQKTKNKKAKQNNTKQKNPAILCFLEIQ